jgi:hypothetical protein
VKEMSLVLNVGLKNKILIIQDKWIIDVLFSIYSEINVAEA